MRSASILRSYPTPVALAAVLLAVALSVLHSGCASEPRFAEGSSSVQNTTYTRSPAKQATPTPPGAHIAPVPPMPQVDLKEPVAGLPAGAIPSGPHRPWRYIVIHHSATDTGGAAEFHKQHLKQGWDELGYHFVIGNGTDTRNGAVEVGPRWTKQKHGAHAKTPDNRFNEYGIGICLVGNFDNGTPSPQQMQTLTNLVASLMQRYRIPASAVIGHQDAGQATACPGTQLERQIVAIRRSAAQAIAARNGNREVTASVTP